MDISNLHPATIRQIDRLLMYLQKNKKVSYFEVFKAAEDNVDQAKRIVDIIEKQGIASVMRTDEEPGFSYVIANEFLPRVMEEGGFGGKLIKERIRNLQKRYGLKIPQNEITKLLEEFPNYEGYIEKELNGLDYLRAVNGISESEERKKRNQDDTLIKDEPISDEANQPNFSSNADKNEIEVENKIEENSSTGFPYTFPSELGSDGEEEQFNGSNTQTFFRFGHKNFSPIDRSISPCFKITEIAEVLANHLDNLGKEKGGQMVGVFGKWGRGKTYFVEHLQKILEKEPYQNKFIFIPFHAWKYQDTPAIWAYLYEEMSKIYLGKYELGKVFKKFQLNIRQEKWNIVTDIVLFGLLWSAITILIGSININQDGFIRDFINIFKNNSWSTIIGGTAFSALIKFYKKEGQSAMELLKKYTKGISFTKHLGEQAEIEKELVNLLTTWIRKRNKKRIILFVDDIDRCSEDKIIQLVDALRVMLEHEKITQRVIVLVAIDEDKLKMAIRYKYRQLLPNNKGNYAEIEKLTGEYLDKLFISGIKLQPLNLNEINEFISKLVKENWGVKTNEADKSNAPSQKTVSENISFPNAENARTTELQNKSLQSQTETQDPIKEEDKVDFILTELSFEEEIKMMLKALTQFKGELTPRQIRIFYYRFQLAKNLYVKLMQSEGEPVITSDLELLISAIQQRTENNKVKSLDNTIDQIAEMVIGY
jgi:hypothetical protein